MTRARDPKTVETVERIITQIANKHSADTARRLVEFVNQYFAGTAAEDLADSADENLYGAAVAHFNFAQQRKPGSAKVHVYNPQLGQHGWQSTHTIVEIVTDDMPFLVDSVRMALNKRGLTTHLIIHPVVKLCRSEQGELTDILDPGAVHDGALTEAVMHCEVDRQTESAVLDGIRSEVQNALADVRASVEDWPAMRDKMRTVLDQLDGEPPPIDEEELDEGKAFLAWIDDNHFTFLGYREYALEIEGGEEVLRSVADTGLGVFRNPGESKVSESFASLSLEHHQAARQPSLLVVTKGDYRSTVHRPSYLDHIGIKILDKKGKVVGEHRFAGLYTSAAYNRNPRVIPLLRKKVRNIVERAGYPQNSHAEKTLLNILDTYPRDELFQVSEQEMLHTALGILHLQERQRIRLFVHQDQFARFVSCIVYVPRERFNTATRLQIQRILESKFNSESIDFTVWLSESVLARLYFVIRVRGGKIPAFDVAEIEVQLRDVTRSWSDDLYDALLDHCGEERGTRLFRRYGSAFKSEYTEHYRARVAVHDIDRMETLEGSGGISMSLYRPLEAPSDELRFKLFRYDKPVSLSEALPMLENMGLTVSSEHPSCIVPEGDVPVWMHDFSMLHGEGPDLDLDRIRDLFQEAFSRVWHGAIENDGFNRLTLRAQLAWREVVILRACSKYLRQTGFRFSHEYMERALAGNPKIARTLIALFHARFCPQDADGNRAQALEAQILTALDDVSNLDEDRILRSFLSLILATMRTNFYQCAEHGGPKSYLAFKFDPEKVPDLPDPRPMYEIFVYSPRVEGIHLRGGSVSRGGVRWSDRQEDFRTEVLGLVKAQMVKNAVIVPVGSKGGFVPKQLNRTSGRDAFLKEGVACYQTFIKGLLDITDNLAGSDIIAPPDVVRHDGDDPYLVVAADKGTATFSDYANEIAIDYDHWLGDAFASGGSVGYDHKAMGITAKGGWESVKRHFRELGVDCQTTDFTVVGIGDMGGDVFGNGMLLSKHIRLVAAFNHLHIFLDPSPDAAKSFKERKRLFELPRSSWADYNPKLISKGGGVFERLAKSIPLSSEIREALDIEADSLTPAEFINVILKAPVDLLWNGGIGTYAKAKHEQHTDAGDRANDALRVDASELRCRVVGEGGNLGLTQRARIEFAAAGGRINTDAIDNSAGVDCSDHEVNIKILLNSVVERGDLTAKQRTELLEEMTGEVGDLVLRNNYLQTQALSCASFQAPSLLEVHQRLIETFEREGRLDRAIECLPDNEEITERRAAGKGLVVPELSVLMAYVKIELFKDLLASKLPDDPYFAQELEQYFPRPLRERYQPLMAEHRLAREIISTVVANDLVNRAGITFAFRLGEETGSSPAHVARAYTVAREIFDVNKLWHDIEALDNQVPAAVQTEMFLDSRRLVERASRWLLRNRPQPLDMVDNIAHFTDGLAEFEKSLDTMLVSSHPKVVKSAAKAMVKQGVPESLANRVARITELYSGLDVVEVAAAVNMTVADVGAVYYRLGDGLELHWLRDQIAALPRENRWQALARAALRDDLYAQEAALTADVLRSETGCQDPKARIEAWMKRNRVAVGRCKQVLGDLKGSAGADFAMMSVAMREIRSLRPL